MKSNLTVITGSCQAWSLNKLPLKNFILITLLCLTTQTSVQAQEVQYSNPSWWFGAAAGANFNFYRGSTQVLNQNFTPPTAFHDGFGAGLYLAPLLEYHRPNSTWDSCSKLDTIVEKENLTKSLHLVIAQLIYQLN